MGWFSSIFIQEHAKAGKKVLPITLILRGYGLKYYPIHA
jgi:hypothetical protein